MPNVNKNLVWSTLDMANAKGATAKAWAAYEAANATRKAAVADLEDVLTAELAKRKMIPDGKAPVYSYRFGVAVAFDLPKAASKAGNKISL